MLSRASTDRLLDDVETDSGVECSRVLDTNSLDAIQGNQKRQREIEKRLLQKLDVKLCFLVLISIMNNIDRSSIASARLQGFEEDLKLTGHQYNTLISINYVGYLFMQIPSNMYLNQLRKPSAYLSCAILLWALFSISTGVSWSFDTVLISRFLLGFTEAVYTPGVYLMLSRWYKRDELGLRLAFFSGGIAASNFLGPLLASGVLIAMEGKLGYAAWRWLFFVEGGLTCILAIVSFYVTPDFPSTPVLWLTADEQMLAQRRMVEDPCDSEQGSAQRSGFVEALTDWRVWWMAIAGSFGLIALSFELYFPTIAATMGYSPTVTLFLCVPPWFLGVITSLLIMRHSDVTKDRFWHIAGPVCIGVIGFIIAILTMNPSLRYLSLFLMVQSDVSYTVVVAWISNSIPNSSSKLAVAIAFVMCSQFPDSWEDPTYGLSNGDHPIPNLSCAAFWHSRYPSSCFGCIDYTLSGLTRN